MNNTTPVFMVILAAVFLVVMISIITTDKPEERRTNDIHDNVKYLNTLSCSELSELGLAQPPSVYKSQIQQTMVFKCWEGKQ